ncbi:MAG TPA: site-specific integrase [Marmoricola sp.]|nr:site-specific integrase [Marmoricola sp.]
MQDNPAQPITVSEFARRYLADRVLRPKTIRGYESLLNSRILPFFAQMTLGEVTLAQIKAWRASLDPATASTNAAAYRLLRSILQAAVEEELIARAPPKIRGAGNAPVRYVAIPATFAELATIVEQMPERLRLLIIIAAFVGLREGELLELRRLDIDSAAGVIKVSRKIDKDPNPSARGACVNCGRPISAPKTRSGVRVVHLPPPFWPLLRLHLAKYADPGPTGLLFPGERTDHMSVRYLMNHYGPARAAAGRPDLTIHHLRHTALTLAGQHGATAAELQARAGHSSQAAMAIYQHATIERDRALAEKIGESYAAWTQARLE